MTARYIHGAAALKRAHARYNAVARAFKPTYAHNDSKLLTASPLSQEQHYALMRQLQWRKEWIMYGEGIMRKYQLPELPSR